MKVIQVGIGRMGNTWLEAVLRSPDVEYEAFVEINSAIADQQATKHDLDRSVIYTSLEEALAKHQPDGIIDVTPPQFHRHVSLTALEAGIPVLSEKPLAHTREAAQDIVDTATRTGVLHMVAQNYRYRVPTMTVKSVLDSGVMGQVGAVTVTFFKGPHFGGFREEMAYPLIIDMSIHHFDLMRHFLDSDPVSVFGRSWNPSWSWYAGDASAVVSLAFEGGITATYNGSWCATAQETSWNADWRFDCENGVLLLKDDVVYMQRLEGVDGFNNINTPLEEIPPVSTERQGQDYLLDEFYQAVTNGRLPATTCHDNIRSLNIIFSLIESFNTA